MRRKLFGVILAVCIGWFQAEALTAGFIKSPSSQMKLIEDSAKLDCEVMGNPIPEVQWWFIEGEERNETGTQLFDGAREDRVHINATYINHATSTLILNNLTLNDTGVYECRASNDPNRNDLRTPPKVKWIRSQANVIVFEHAAITTKPEVVNDQNQTSATLSCNLTNPSSLIKGHYWTNNGKIIDKSESNSDELYIKHEIKKVDYHSAGLYACVFLTEPQVNATIEVKALPHVVAYKHSENANEKDKAVLTCVSHGYPLPTDWRWYKLKDDEIDKMPIVNGTDDKYEMKNTPNKTMLYVKDLDINEDMGMYQCQGTNEMGSASDKIQLRVRSQLAALWPFLGIVAEVIILITIIFIYEKRRKPDEINDGSAPLKSNAATNHKDKNVRQRNSN
ncbi:basigin-like isoform X2 [Sinocyclocheilus rhinocerous]|uniref:basigin-like isoform X2 n=1 Tax=Sinocyclocheilus rhinocerous TaxID=307959 RepID=UPI0007B93AFD|nr:PREDICTED: basigin-like isoform X2 [Sinocyclocheilus rhinocerous]